MKYQAILFDLDGTLLPMDQDLFIKAYFGLLAKKLAPLGYDPDALVKAIWVGTAAMVKNDGSRSNEAVFWESFTALMGEHTRADEPVFAEYYRNEFQQVQGVCGFAPAAAETVRLCHDLGADTVLATNPIFPSVGTESRIRWAGLRPEDFRYYTVYENSSFCKPNPDYYREILQKLDLRAEDCLMVGNDAVEDGAAAELGIPVFLLTDCLINKNNQDISRWANGSFPELMNFIREL